jgi:hypothetical protein
MRWRRFSLRRFHEVHLVEQLLQHLQHESTVWRLLHALWRQNKNKLWRERTSWAPPCMPTTLPSTWLRIAALECARPGDASAAAAVEICRLERVSSIGNRLIYYFTNKRCQTSIQKRNACDNGFNRKF